MIVARAVAGITLKLIVGDQTNGKGVRGLALIRLSARHCLHYAGPKRASSAGQRTAEQ
jgi:hypothetical protein